MQYIIHYSCCSHIGICRSLNQDNYICNGLYLDTDNPEENARDSLYSRVPPSGILTGVPPLLLGVFDGMGGEECGEIASLIAAKCAAKLTIGTDPIASLLRFCQESNMEICRFAAENRIGTMGTTAALLAFSEKEIALCNIGDSKVFRFADSQLAQISKDHLSAAEYGRKPPLSQNLGIPPSEMIIDPYVARGHYQEGDLFLICSDGLTDMVAKKEIEHILQTTAFRNVLSKLLKTALEHGGKDNTTIILCKIDRKKNRLFRK